MFVYDNCACALTENSNYDPESFLKSFFPIKVHAGVHWNMLYAEIIVWHVLSFEKGFKGKQKGRLNEDNTMNGIGFKSRAEHV